MRIYSSATWLLSVSLANVVVASNITFDQSGFNECLVLPYGNSTTVYSTIFNRTQFPSNSPGGGWMMSWNSSGAGQNLTVNNVALAQQDDAGTTSLIANGSDTGSSSTAASQARSLVSERDSISQGDTTQGAQSFPVDYSRGSLTLTNTLVTSTLAKHTDKTLFFQVQWTDGKGSTGYSYSLPWAVTDELPDAYTLMDRHHALDRTSSPVYVDGSSPQVDTALTAASSSTLSSTSSTSTAGAGSNSKSKSHGLSTGAIVGIAIGCVAGLIIMGVIAGCFCFRRRKGKGGHGEAVPKGAHTMQDVIAEKEARVGILEGEQHDTPYSEQGSHRAAAAAAAAAAQHPRSRGLILTGMNGSGVDMGTGQAATSNDRGGGGKSRSSVVYSPLGGAPTPAAGAPVVLAPTIGGSNAAPKHTQPLSLAIHEGTSMMDPAQHDGAFTPYTDHPAGVAAPCPLLQQQQQQQQDVYSRHHHVVDGAGLAQQGHLDDETARHEQQQQEQQQPISPDSARGVCPGSTPRTRGDAYGRRSTTPSGISGRYAHLVEEGMTDDEIRRLEEEERALDEAIEEAGRGLAR